jgi:hypothetical protein
MKILLTFFVLFFSSSLVAEVFYCTEDNAVGYDRTNNLNFTTFKPTRFIVNIDFELKKIETDELGFSKLLPQECLENKGALNCINAYGTAFLYNIKRKDFVLLEAYLKDGITTDDIILSKGNCEKF